MRGPGSIEPAEVVDEDEDVEDPAVELKIEKVNFGLCLRIKYAYARGRRSEKVQKLRKFSAVRTLEGVDVSKRPSSSFDRNLKVRYE